MPENDKVRENRLRRMAERQRYHLRKSRRRDPLAFDFGTYRLIDVATGLEDARTAGGVSLDEIERILNEGRQRPPGGTDASWQGGER